MEFDNDIPSPTSQPSPRDLNGFQETISRPSPAVTISNVLVILPSMTRGFQPKNYHPPAYQNIGRSPSLPVTDILSGPRDQIPAPNLSRSRMSIAYGHAASQPYSGERLLDTDTVLNSRNPSDSSLDAPGSATPPYTASSGHLSPAARKEITAQLSIPITPNSLPSDARRQSISTLLPAGVMSAKLSQLVLEEEAANQRELEAIAEKEYHGAPPVTIDSSDTVNGEAIAIPGSASDVGKTMLKPRPLSLSRSTSNSESLLSSNHDQAISAKPRKRVRSRPQTSAADLGSAAENPPTFGSESVKSIVATSQDIVSVPARLQRQLDPKRSRMSGTGKPGWEGDEVVNILRENGIQVSTLRTASHLGQYISHIHDLPLASGDATNITESTAQVIMVPLSDSPTLPSLSLLLTQGTTPSAICFQQDLLDRARRTEDDWLPSALHIIAEAIEQSGQQSRKQDCTTQTHVIAYSANPALSPSVVERCMQAGAIGVLQPPYDSRDTLKLIKRMIAYEEKSNAARHAFDGLESRRASIASASQAHDSDSASSRIGRKQSLHPLSTLPPATRTDIISGTIDGPSPFISDLAARRRSVDTGGLSLALQRASDHIMTYESQNQRKRSGKSPETWHIGKYREARTTANSPQGSPSLQGTNKMRTDRSASVADVGSHLAQTFKVNDIPEADEEEEEEEMAIAELLSEMYRQTRVAIEIQMEDYEEFAAPIASEHRASLIQSLASWEFKPHLLSEVDLFQCACLLFEAVFSIRGLRELDVGSDQLRRFLFAIRAIYHAPNPYHNYVHAVDVLQATYTFLVANGVAPPVTYLLDSKGDSWVRKEVHEGASREQDNARMTLHGLLRPQDVLTVMIGAMGHDVGHPGLSNVFMKNAKTPLSQIYSDKSVLENMHCILVVQLLRKHGFQFLLTGSSSVTAKTGLTVVTNAASTSEPSPMSDLFPNVLPASATSQSFRRDVQPGAVGDWRGFKKLLYATVLSTDMSLHFDWLKRFNDLGKRARAGLCVDMSEAEEEEARTLVCQSLIKCADISNPTRPIEVSEYWSTVLLDEWAVQASLERKLNLPISVVASADALIQAKGQIGFIDLFTLPLYETAADAMPDLRYFADQCIANRALWQARYDTLQAIAGDPQPISRSPLVDRDMLKDLPPEARYKMLFPLSIPSSLLEGVSPKSEEIVPVEGASRPGSLYASSQREETPSAETKSMDEEVTNALNKLKSASSDVRALRAAYRVSIRRHPSNSFRHYQSMVGKSRPSLQTKLEG
ncbi:hypothetical protein NliqN6_0558 [Naganishia liquefaciens]|uniref:Phosphodiesterase n=1 Tax=Naganishia liquefaciens TaxID=104408 RepID=A0A8H3TNS6_9TREE|nr:hypothetical protein NliqN6_0558 [Naganishia liquefaciens]